MLEDLGLLLIYPKHEVPLMQLYETDNTFALSNKLDYLNGEAAARQSPTRII